MQTSMTSFSSLATACASQQAAHFEDKPHDNPSLEAPANVDVDMLALSANLFSYLEDASTAAEAGQDLKPVDANDVENMGLSPGSVKAGRPSAAGPLRHRRGYQDRQLSINSFASNTSNSDPNRQGPASNDSNEAKTSTSTEHRVVKVGDHAFTIPMSSPIIPPQLQANVRMTSTGRPSHARKVPEDHVKRPRNAFILFRSFACTNKLLPTSLGITDHRQVSRIVGQLWKGLKPEEKAVWEKLAHEEKEKHKLMNPNYRYRPTYRKEVPSKRRRKKAIDDEEIEEEDRKCEVVARVLLEGREVDTEELEKEVEEQKIKDIQEGRQRTGRSRSRSRSNSKLSDGMNNLQQADAQAQLFFLGMGGRPSSAPPQGADQSNDDHHMPGSNSHMNGVNKRGKRSQTIATSGPDLPFGEYSSLAQHTSLQGQGTNQSFATDSTGNGLPTSLRNAANLQHLFHNQASGSQSEPAQSATPFNQFPTTSQSPFLSNYTGFKGNNGDVSLLSPSFSRKFSLGRWEVPHHPLGQAYSNAGQAPSHPFMTQQSPDASAITTAALQQTATTTGTVTSATSSMGSQEQTSYNTVAQTSSDQTFDPAAVPPGYNFVPTYVYLSKEDAQNPQIVEHYLSQGFGVSYDA